jgi:hypothetical protein
MLNFVDRIAMGILVTFMTNMGAAWATATPDLGDRGCQAADAASFSHCVERAMYGEVDRIVVTGVIQCGHDLTCGAVLIGVDRPFAIIGGTAGAGFARAADNRASFGLRFENSSGPIMVRGLRFNMGRSAVHGSPGAPWTDPDCPTPDACPQEAISIVGSSHVLVDQVDVADAPRFGISMVGSSGITIRRSTFSRCGLHGIWIASQPASRGLHIENNQFLDIRSNGAMLSGSPPDAGDPLGMNTVTGNLFDHDHNAAVYYACGPTGHGPCAGGELDIEHDSHSWLVADNEFRHGVLDEDPSLTRDLRITGVEVAPADVHAVAIEHNYFHDLTAGAIAIDSPSIAPEVRVVDNTFDGLGGREPAIGEVDRLGESHGNHPGAQGGGGWVRPEGRLTWTMCRSNSAQSCGAIIRWRGQAGASQLRVIVDGAKVFARSSPAGGEQAAPWLGPRPVRFDLYAGATLLDTISLWADAASQVREQL